jgi:hypothetical protein
MARNNNLIGEDNFSRRRVYITCPEIVGDPDVSDNLSHLDKIALIKESLLGISRKAIPTLGDLTIMGYNPTSRRMTVELLSDIPIINIGPLHKELKANNYQLQ